MNPSFIVCGAPLPLLVAEMRAEPRRCVGALFFERLPLLLSGLMRRLLSLNLLLKLCSQGARRADLTRSIRHLICEAVDLRVQIGDGRLVGVELIALLGDLFPLRRGVL